MIQDLSVDEVMTRLRGGDPSAADLIFHRFVNRLVALASQQFDARFRAKAEPEDVVQSVYRSFFRRDERAPFALADWDSLWALLAAITVRKCINKRTYWLAARRSVGRELVPAPGQDEAAWWQAVDAGPTPVQAAVLADLLEAVLGGLPPKHRAPAELSLQGYSPAEVADRCGCSERTVARVVARIKERIEAIGAVSPAA